MPPTSASTKALSTNKLGPVPKGCLWIFGLIFIGVGLSVIYGVTILPYQRSQEAQAWPSVPCRIESSQVVYEPPTDSKGSGSYSPKIHYLYQVAGRDYDSGRYSFRAGSSWGKVKSQEIVSQFPAGAEAICYYRPSDPTMAVLDRELPSDLWTGLFGLLFIGGGGLVFMVPYWLSRPARHRVSSISSRAILRDGVPYAVGPSTGPIVLQPSGSPVARFVGVAIFAVLWNGAILGVAYFVRQSNHGHIPLVTMIVGSIFVFFGVLAIIGAVSNFLAMFNPRIRLTASSDTLPLGSELQLQWATEGKVEKLTKLRIYLEGQEEAVYQQGKNTSTARCVFIEVPFVETSNIEQMRAAGATITVPAGSMHTLDAPHNRILWRIRVRGEIPRWPDVDESYRITVLPRASAA